MSELPRGWTTATVQELAILTFDGPFGSNLKTSDYTTEGAQVVRLENVGRLAFNRQKQTFIAYSKFEQLLRHELHPDDVIVSSFISDNVRVCLVPGDLKHRLINKADVFCIRVDKKKGLPSYISYRLAAIDIFHHLSNDVVHGATRPRIGLRDLQGLVINVPPLPEQQRIVAKIDSLSAKSARARDRLDHIPRLVEKCKQAILAAAFRGELTRPLRIESREASSSGDLLHAARRRRASAGLRKRNVATDVHGMQLPIGWQWISPDELASDARHSLCIGPFGSNLVKSEYRDRGVPLVFVRHIRSKVLCGDKTICIDAAKAVQLVAHAVRGGDVLITKMGDPPGDVAIYPMDAPSAIITADCIKLTVDSSLASNVYASLALSSDLLKSQMRDITKGVAQQKISLETFRRLAIPLAPLREQAEIVRRIETAFAWIDRLAKEATSAKKLVDHLDQAVLAKAFRGELVPQNPDDEPASVLLERIKAERASVPATKRGRRSRAEA